ncbi:uncharacterized protein TRIREDRAFT_111168 [Trichoderma reesei QM6a]|uniref:Predicted protein n=1 Tax=Hypocrea jecorina (strain QM6a) TaxID=431241 RepID=G0RU36_HYPJQ|nr:uncharacterized protein TRIREDRAFT_111168 [Trichoderma reesei QM6a]EGR45319.1 predicted protein [Trichoderma reesei QM6a]
MPFLRTEKPKEQYPRTITLRGSHAPGSEWQDRMRLFESFQRLYQAHSKTSNGLNATMFAVIMIAPLSQMRRMLEDIRYYNPNRDGPNNPAKLLLYAMYTAPEAVRSCIPNRRQAMSTTSTRNQPSQPSMTPVSPSTYLRGNTPSTLEKRREQVVCLFTVSRDAEKADIFPLCTTIGDAFQPLDALLQCFWGERIRDRWVSRVTDPGVINSPRNFLSMNRQLHFWWDNAAFALKPLSESETSIVVQWHWLQESCLSPRMMIPPNAEYTKYVSRQVGDSWGSLKHAFGKTLQTGQVFTIRVDDPGQLPCFELLELQWDLLRVAAISGAGNFQAYDPFYDAEELDNFV